MTRLTLVRMLMRAPVLSAPPPQSSARSNVQKLFVANIPWTVGNRELRLYFSKFGHVSSVSVVYDKQCGMSRGFGFVQYSNRSGYTAAVNQPLHSLEGRAMIVQPSSS